MKFGIYVHIPYCLQQCPYCDFATVRSDHPVTREDYTHSVLQEIRSRNRVVPYKKVSTLYFGGGTPSLAGPKNIAAVIQELKRYFDFSAIEEVTLEINPGTVSEPELLEYLDIGVTRFSVGVQTFNSELLKKIGREHSEQSTHQTLALLKSKNVLYTADILFALPHQSLKDLDQDLNEIIQYKPQHISGYCLTVPDKNPMSAYRPSEDVQVQMFYHLEERLKEIGLTRYEVSNYALPGKESRHNSLYWNDSPYWGLGMSAHSYFLEGPYGTRFWNPPSIAAYTKQVQSYPGKNRITESFPKEQFEDLTLSQALTDFCHTRLRTTRGLNINELTLKLGHSAENIVLNYLKRLEARSLAKLEGDFWKIPHKALVMSEQVFQEMTFLPSDL